MKYKVEFYGWEIVSKGYTITDEQVIDIQALMEEMFVDDLSEIRDNIEEVGIDLNDDGDLFNISKPLINDSFWGRVKDENDNIILDVNFNDMGEIYDHVSDDINIDKQYPYENYVATPEYMENKTNVMLVIDENKGGLFDTYFESDTLPTNKDFSIMDGSIETPEGDFNFISRIFFKNQELNPENYLDNNHKSETIKLYTKDGIVI